LTRVSSSSSSSSSEESEADCRLSSGNPSPKPIVRFGGGGRGPKDLRSPVAGAEIGIETVGTNSETGGSSRD
jgi:hypothetical protein